MLWLLLTKYPAEKILLYINLIAIFQTDSVDEGNQ